MKIIRLKPTTYNLSFDDEHTEYEGYPSFVDEDEHVVVSFNKTTFVALGSPDHLEVKIWPITEAHSDTPSRWQG